MRNARERSHRQPQKDPSKNGQLGRSLSIVTGGKHLKKRAYFYSGERSFEILAVKGIQPENRSFSAASNLFRPGCIADRSRKKKSKKNETA